MAYVCYHDHLINKKTTLKVLSFNVVFSFAPLEAVTQVFATPEQVLEQQVALNKEKENLRRVLCIYILHICNGEIVDADALGNIVYGYLGRVMGINEKLMYAVPGAVQLIKGTSSKDWGDSYYYDPRDQSRIEQGTKIYDQWHAKK